MSNLEQSMKAVAEAMTGKKADTIPDRLEDICYFIAENYKRASSLPERELTEAPEDISAEPTKEDFNGLIAKLKEANVFK